MYTPHILIVEDDDAVRGELVELLRALGARVASVADGEGAMDAGREQSFDLVLCDYKLKAENGLDVLSALSALPSAPDPSKLFLMSAHRDITMSGQGDMAATMGGLLQKPIGGATLRKLVAAAVAAEARRC